MPTELKEESTDAIEYVQQAELLIGQQMYQEAFIYIEKAKKSNQMLPDIYLAEGITYANLDEYDLAKKSFEKARMLDNENPVVYYHLGNVAFVNEDHLEGVKNYNKAIYHDPLEPVYRVRKASLYLQTGDFEEALQASEELMVNCPDQFEGYHIASGSYILLKKYDEAEALLERAEILFPEDTDIIFDRIRLLVVRQKFDEAIRYIEKLENMTTSDMDKRNLIIEKAKLYMQQEKLEKAAELLESTRIYETDDQIHTESHYYLLNIYMILE